jgi:hypothetical protein
MIKSLTLTLSLANPALVFERGQIILLLETSWAFSCDYPFSRLSVVTLMAFSSSHSR